MPVTVIGAGPAGSSAALAALEQGASVDLFDKSRFPRHKVCGEFLSPEMVKLLVRLGVWEKCELQSPATLRRVFLSIGDRKKKWDLREPARGLSRFQMDRILLEHAVQKGARFHRERMETRNFAVLAQGRQATAIPGQRLFGFKAHFTGQADDVMSLYFFEGAYVGINAVEGGSINVCGLAPEKLLASLDFKIDELLNRHAPTAERMASLNRTMEWLVTGPLVFGTSVPPDTCYAAGDCAAFIDPFTGSGMLGAVSTGILAGRAAAQQKSPLEYQRQAARILNGQQKSARLLRAAISSGWAERMLPWIPGALLFHSTRPRTIVV